MLKCLRAEIRNVKKDMSSHHVVREAQEPALLILQSSYLSTPHVEPLLEWSPTIVVVGEAVREVVESGVKIDAAVLPEDQAQEAWELLCHQAPLSLVSVGKEESLLLRALAFLAEREHHSVNILSDSGKENAKLLKELSEQTYITNIVVLTEMEKKALCRSGAYTKWFPAKEKLIIQPAGWELVLTTGGFKEDKKEAVIKEEQLFETQEAGTIIIRAKGPFWVVEQLV